MSTRSGKNNKLFVHTESSQSSPAPLSPGVTQSIKIQLSEQAVIFAAQLKAMEDRVMERLSTIAADISNLRVDFRSLSTRVNALDKRCDSYEAELDKLRAVVTSLENEAVASDVIVFGMPNDIEPAVAIKKLLSVTTNEQLPVRKVFRAANTNNATGSIPIIAKLHAAHDRANLFRALAELRKKNKRPLCLNDIGLSGEASLKVHECLSTNNRILLQKALLHKRNKRLSSVFSLRGHVFVRAGIDGNAIKINNCKDLEKVVGVEAATA